jgi:hypothetical protein
LLRRDEKVCAIKQIKATARRSLLPARRKVTRKMQQLTSFSPLIEKRKSNPRLCYERLIFASVCERRSK